MLFALMLLQVDAEMPLQKLINDANTQITPYLLSLAALAVVTMAIIQALKALLPVRYAYQSWFFWRWLKRHASIAEERLGLKPDAELTSAALQEKAAHRSHAYAMPQREYIVRPIAKTKVPNSSSVKVAERAETELIFLAADGNALALFDAEGRVARP
jgi:hypothetical protein